MSMKKKFVISFGLLGLLVAILLAGMRLYMLHHEPQFQDVMYGGWFDTVTLIFWPSAFYLSIMVAEEPIKVAAVVWSVAIFFNPIIYALVG